MVLNSDTIIRVADLGKCDKILFHEKTALGRVRGVFQLFLAYI